VRAFVTGASGFLGSYVTELLVRRGAEVAVLLRKTSDTWRIDALLPELRVIEGDLLDIGAVSTTIEAFRPDVIFHLAWYGVGNDLRDDPAQVDVNLLSSLALLRLGLNAKCGAWVGIGSQAEYGPQNRMLDERAPTEPTTTYGAVKLCVGVLARQLAVGTPMRFAWLRLFSAYGPKDHNSWMIPQLINTLQRGSKPSLTACEQQWDYLFVEDAAEAVCQVAAAPNAHGVFNLGSGEARSLRDVVEQIRDQVAPGQSLGIGEVPYRRDQVMHLQADISRLRHATGWAPKVGLEEGLRRTAQWYCTNRNGEQ
jgi:nucleoside-diphosphate-sugar epimerase